MYKQLSLLCKTVICFSAIRLATDAAAVFTSEKIIAEIA